MKKRTMTRVLWTDTSLVAALGQVESGWLKIGRQGQIDILRTNTGGTYVFELDWSADAGQSVQTTDTITTTAGSVTDVNQSRHPAQWVKLRVKNTHATNPFTAHSTSVAKYEQAGGLSA